MLEKIKNSIQKNTMAWSTIAISVIVLSVLFFLYLNSDGFEGNKFRYEDHLEDVLVTINDEKVTLKDMSYYIIVIESNLNAQAVAINPDNPKKYWNTPLNNGEEAGFLCDQAKKDTMDACIRDIIYSEEANKAGIELTEDEIRACEEDAKEQEKAMTGQAIEVTKYEYKDVYDAVYRTHILKKYMTMLMSEGYAESELDVDGAYYNQIKATYNIEVNEELWGNVTLGQVTIN